MALSIWLLILATTTTGADASKCGIDLPTGAMLGTSCQNVSILFGWASRITDDGFEKVVASLPKAATAISFKFVSTSYITDNGFEKGMANLPKAATSISFNFGLYSKITDDGFEKGMANMPKAAKSISFNFGAHSKITDDGFEKGMANIPKTATSISFNFCWYSKITDDGFEKVVANIPKAATSISFNFGDRSKITDDGFEKGMANMPKAAKSISFIFDSDSKITDDGFERGLANMPKAAKSISFNFVGASKITDDGFEKGVANIPKAATSISFNFGFNSKITDDGFEKGVANIPKAATSISFKFGHGSKITDEGLTAALAVTSEDSFANFLVNQGADVDRALHLAAANGDVRKIKALVSLGASLESKDRLSRTALDIATLNHHKDAMRFLESKTSMLTLYIRSLGKLGSWISIGIGCIASIVLLSLRRFSKRLKTSYQLVLPEDVGGEQQLFDASQMFARGSIKLAAKAVEEVPALTETLTPTQLWQIIRKKILSYPNHKRMQGVAPPGDLERRAQQILDTLKKD